MDSNKHAGDLDDSFGKGGIVEPPDTVNTFGQVINVLVSSEEKIFIIGELARHYSIVSLNKDGSMNSDFNNGKIIKDIFKAGFLSAASEIKLTQDNNILIAGTYEETEIINYHALALYKQDGSLSANFGQGGKIIIYLPAEAGKYVSPPKIIPLPDKKILAVSTRQANYRSIAVLYRLEQNGEIDNTFGDKGYIDISYRKRETSAQSMLRQPDGKLLIAGMVRVDSEYGSYVGFVARFNSDGTPDTSFAEEGYFVNTKTYGFEQITSIELLLHGKIVATGNATSDKKMTGLLLCLTT